MENNAISPLCVQYLCGWYGWENDGERDFQWIADNAELTLSLAADDNMPPEGALIVTVGTPHANALRILSDNSVLFDTSLAPGWHILRLNLTLITPQKLRLEVMKSFKDGLRTLGVMIGRMGWIPNFNTRFYVALEEIQTQHSTKPDKPYISAYYYLWYFTPEGVRSTKRRVGKWAEGYTRALLEPPQFPTLGEYVMNDPQVICAHIDWAADHGIDCFIANWEGMVGHRKFLSENLVHILQGSKEDRSASDGKISYSCIDSTGNGWDATSQGWHKNGYPIPNLKRMQFSILIESRLIVETWPPTADSKECLKAFSDALTYMAENFFGSPQWQRINNKPVVYIYEVYSWKGDLAQFQTFRSALDAAVCRIYDPLTGKNFTGVYLVADVVYPYPQDMDRLVVFDGVTGYQPYPPVNSAVVDQGVERWQYRGTDLFRCPAFEEYHQKFAVWSRIKNKGLIPTVIPRYNDRGVRGAVNNYAYPPASKPPYTDVQDAREARLFIGNIEAQLRWTDSKINMLNINSWNEWFEDTSIEPVGYIPNSKIPDYYGQGNNVGQSTSKGHDKVVPDKIVIYDHNGHTWIDTPEEVKKAGIDVTQGFEWPCYGFDYLYALKKFFGLTYNSNGKN